MSEKAKGETNLKSVVGEPTYSVWIKMLSSLVPDSRTHRLAPLIAGMLQYASVVAYEKFKDSPPEGSIAECLIFASEMEESEEAKAILRRVSRRGGEYNIVDQVILEFLHWGDMPWE
jgi:hypothetical protein